MRSKIWLPASVAVSEMRVVLHQAWGESQRTVLGLSQQMLYAVKPVGDDSFVSQKDGTGLITVQALTPPTKRFRSYAAA